MALTEYRYEGVTWQFEEGEAPEGAVPVKRRAAVADKGRPTPADKGRPAPADKPDAPSDRRTEETGADA